MCKCNKYSDFHTNKWQNNSFKEARVSHGFPAILLTVHLAAEMTE